jgi:aldose sugar dehydrogenase
MSRRAPVMFVAATAALVSTLAMGGIHAQETRSIGGPAAQRTWPFGSDVYVPLPSTPTVYQTSDYKIRVVTVVDGLSRPWSLLWLPTGEMLVTERSGALRIIKNGVLDPTPIDGVPKDIMIGTRDGLMDIALHPKFAENHFLYLTYTKRGPKYAPEGGAPVEQRNEMFTGTDPNSTQAIALARGRLEGHSLKDVHDLFVAKDWVIPKDRPTSGSRIAFGKDGMLYMTVAVSMPVKNRAQDPTNHQGKVLRLRDDGTAPPDNPYFGKPGYLPEIYTMGHRDPLGLAFHPETGDLWELEMGPQGGDEINILKAAHNYGWPKVSMGRDYSGEPWAPHTPNSEFDFPIVFWAPAIAPSGLAFYRGDKFPMWKDSAFVGGMALPHLERVVFNAKGQHIRREWLMVEMKQRIRDVRQGPDGYLYLLTDASKGALLRIEPAE